MEPEDSLPYSQKPATGFCPESDWCSSPHTFELYFPKSRFNIILSYTL
jgi:hypothetical protein